MKAQIVKKQLNSDDLALFFDNHRCLNLQSLQNSG